jgi:hypothetical protein
MAERNRSDPRYHTEKFVQGMERRGELIPGGGAKLLAMIHEGETAAFTPRDALKRLGTLLAAPRDPTPAEVQVARAMGVQPVPDSERGRGRVYLNVEYQPAKAEAPLRSAIKALGLTDSNASTLYDSIAADMATADPADYFVAIHRALTSPEHSHRDPWPADEMTSTQLRVRRVLTDMATSREIRATSAEIEHLARTWGEERAAFGHGGHRHAAEVIFARLSHPSMSAWWGDPSGTPPKYEIDWRRHFAEVDRAEHEAFKAANPEAARTMAGAF